MCIATPHVSSWICCGVSNYLATVLAKAFGSFGSTIISYMALDSSTLWRVVVATVFGVVFSFTPMKNIEGAGASKVDRCTCRLACRAVSSVLRRQWTFL
jgi:hypothetical protein